MKFDLPDIRHDKAGFESLVCFYAKAQDIIFDNIEIDMQKTTWFDADMCAAFGALLYRISDNLNTIKLINISPNIETILAKNGFLTHYGIKKVPDTWSTTIPYQRFDIKDERYFAEYIEQKFMGRHEVPPMSALLRKKFQKNMCEIFSNAVLHSHTKLGIYSCGQFFPTKHRLNFSVADLGIGIRQNISNFGIDLTAKEAIHWAISDRNTTKVGQIPGGLGLKLLIQFIDINGGCIRIVSDRGYWKRENKKDSSQELTQPFPGTVINIEINTADDASYKLSTELTAEDIF